MNGAPLLTAGALCPSSAAIDGAMRNTITFLMDGNTVESDFSREKSIRPTTTLGSLTRSAVADLAVLDYEPPTPVNAQNIVPHFLFGFSSSSVESVMVGGTWMLWNRTHPMIDEEDVMTRARNVAMRLWNKLT